MKITAENNSEKTTLSDDAAIYSKRDEKSASERFKELKGKDKWQFFKDYVLVKLIVGLIIAALLAHLLYSTFGPKPETVLYVAFIDNPFDKPTLDSMKNVLIEKFVTDEKKEEITLDSDFYFISNEYNARLKFVTLTAGGTIDIAVFPEKEFATYLESQAYTDLTTIMDKSMLDALEPYLIRSEADGKIYAVDVTDYIGKTLGAPTTMKYYAACISNSKYKEKFEGFIGYMFGL